MYLMHPETGTIDSAENWKVEIAGWGDNLLESERQYASLIHVIMAEGEWAEVR